MSDNPILTYHREIQDYLRSAERLLAAAATSAFSEDELALVKYYAAEVQKMPVYTAK
jgi:hypothetical protein